MVGFGAATEVATIVGAATSGAMPCVPAWSRESKPCPYGSGIGLPFAAFTLPFELSPASVVACLYSMLPFFVTVANVAVVAKKRRPREMIWLLCTLSLNMFNELLKSMFSEPRPESSCLTTCGMPSGHSCYAVGLLLIILLWDSVSRSIDEIERDRPRRSLHGAVLAAALLPILWSRVQLGDHTFRQVIVGACVGALGAGVWLVCLGPCAEAFLEQVMRRVRREMLHDAPASIAAAASQREPVLDRSLLGPSHTSTELASETKPPGGFWGIVVEDGEMPLQGSAVFS